MGQAAIIATATRVSPGSSMLRPITLISCVIAAAIAAPGKAQETELEEVVISG